MHRLALLLLLPVLLLADGGMVVPEIYQVSEYGQVAIIGFSGGQEQLTIATGFGTRSPDIGWIVPAPSLPTVDTVPSGVFTALELHTRPIYRGSPMNCNCGYVALSGEGKYSDSSGVVEVSGGILGDYTYQVLRASGADTLLSYLRGHGYSVPLSAIGVFDHYLQKRWNYFVVARIYDTIGLEYSTRNVGIRLTFATDSIVYPLYISRIGAQAQSVILYVLADHRQMFPGGDLKFSGPVGPATFPGFPGLVAGPSHLTKLVKWYEPERLDDIYLRRAPDDKSYRDIEYGSPYYMAGMLGMLLLFGSAFLVQRRRSAFKRRPW